jgi:hypothetical protein
METIALIVGYVAIGRGLYIIFRHVPEIVKGLL